MTITLSWEQVLLIALGIAGLILLIYLILFMKKLIETLTKVDSILDDGKIISQAAADKTKEIDGILSNVGGAVGIMADAVKGNQNVVKAATNVVNAVTSLIGTFKGKDK